MPLPVSFFPAQFQAFSFTVRAVDESFFLLLPSFLYAENALTFAMAPNVFGSTIIQMTMADQDHRQLHNEGVRSSRDSRTKILLFLHLCLDFNMIILFAFISRPSSRITCV